MFFFVFFLRKLFDFSTLFLLVQLKKAEVRNHKTDQPDTSRRTILTVSVHVYRRGRFAIYTNPIVMSRNLWNELIHWLTLPVNGPGLIVVIISLFLYITNQQIKWENYPLNHEFFKFGYKKHDFFLGPSKASIYLDYQFKTSS